MLRAGSRSVFGAAQLMRAPLVAMPPAAAVLAQATSVSEMRESLFQRVFASAAAPPPSLYDQLGGPGKAEVAIEAVVTRFYEKLLPKPRMGDLFFKGIDMTKQRKHQTTFITFALGGPSKPYVGRAMNPAHARVRKLGLTDADFDTVAVTLADTLREFKLTEAQIKQAMDVVGTTRESIMGRAD